jgi:large subunit ribosomal protein L10
VLKAEKQEVINSLREQFEKSSSVICVDFRGVNVEKITQFRRELRELSVDYQVVKNTLTRRAIVDTMFQELDQFLAGPTGIIFCPDEVAESAKVVTKFAKDTDENPLAIKGGIVDGTVFDAAGIQKVATLPSRQELLAQLVSALQSPVSGLVGTLQGVIRECVYTLQAIAEKQSDDGSV